VATQPEVFTLLQGILPPIPRSIISGNICIFKASSSKRGKPYTEKAKIAEMFILKKETETKMTKIMIIIIMR